MFLSFAKIISAIIAIVGTTYLLPIGVALYHGEQDVIPCFAIPMLVSWLVFVFFFLIGRKQKVQLSIRSSFVVVAVAWLTATAFGVIPLYASGAIPNLTDAFFESCSGFSTTGATIVNDIEVLPRSINLWRCQMHWIGGMGIVMLTVALLPILGVGGFQLIKAETTGPEKGKFTPKITTTAKLLWFIYAGMTVVETILLMIAGMDFIDALSHAFATLGTGGFSTRNASIGSYNSLAVDIICSSFMFLAGINFTLYYYLFTKRFSLVKRNSELKVYLCIVFGSILFIALCEIQHYGSFLQSLRYTSFQTLSVMSTTGFATDDYTTWSYASQAVIFMLFFIGGCSGSTSGGVKVIRWVILSKQFHNEIRHIIHPHGVFTIRLDQEPGRKDVVFSVAAFFFIYVILLVITTLFACMFGLDIFSSFTGAVSMLGNVGPAFNALGPANNYAALAAPIKWWYCFMMVAGRLEFYTIIIFFSPSFWKKY